MRVLLVEDDLELGAAIKLGLEQNGHACDWVKSGRDGLVEAAAGSRDAIVLDLLLPDLPGLTLLERLRATGSQTPVLVLTALGSVEERVTGLRAGADDYLVKPFAFAELLARLSAITRRALQTPLRSLAVGPLVMDLITRRVQRDGQDIDLTPTEMKLLEHLMRHAGQVVTRRMLCEHLWDADWEGVTNVIEVHVNRLRGKIDRDFNAPLLQTVRGRGYLIAAPPKASGAT